MRASHAVPRTVSNCIIGFDACGPTTFRFARLKPLSVSGGGTVYVKICTVVGLSLSTSPSKARYCEQKRNFRVVICLFEAILDDFLPRKP